MPPLPLVGRGRGGGASACEMLAGGTRGQTPSPRPSPPVGARRKKGLEGHLQVLQPAEMTGVAVMRSLGQFEPCGETTLGASPSPPRMWGRGWGEGVHPHARCWQHGARTDPLTPALSPCGGEGEEGAGGSPSSSPARGNDGRCSSAGSRPGPAVIGGVGIVVEGGVDRIEENGTACDINAHGSHLPAKSPSLASTAIVLRK
jgi:hypothetical protein